MTKQCSNKEKQCCFPWQGSGSGSWSVKVFYEKNIRCTCYWTRLIGLTWQNQAIVVILLLYIYLLLLSSMVCFFYFLHLCLSLLWFSSSRSTTCSHNAQLTIFAEQAAEMHCSVACNASPVLWTHGCWERLTCRYGCRQINRTTLVEYSLDVINPSALSMLGSEWQHTSRKTHMSLL